MGGVATAFEALAAELESAGHEVGVLVPYAEDVDSLAIDKRHIVGYAWRRRCRSRIVKRMLNAFNIWTGWVFYFALIKKIPHDVFCLFLPTPDYQWARYVKNPKICWLHALAPKPRNDFTGRMWRREIKRDLDRFGTLAAVSPAVANSWQSAYGLVRMPQVVGNLIDCGRIRRLGATKKWPLKNSTRKRIVCVGRVSHEKGQRRLIEAVAGLENIEVVFVGDGADRERCEMMAKELGLSGRICFVGSRDNPYSFVAAADLTVVPSYEEGFGLVAIESLILGTPVLATDCGGTRFALAEGRYGMLVENSVEGLKNGICAWLADPSSVIPSCGFSSAVAEIESADRSLRNTLRGIFAQFQLASNN